MCSIVAGGEVRRYLKERSETMRGEFVVIPIEDFKKILEVVETPGGSMTIVGIMLAHQAGRSDLVYKYANDLARYFTSGRRRKKGDLAVARTKIITEALG